MLNVDDKTLLIKNKEVFTKDNWSENKDNDTEGYEFEPIDSQNRKKLNELISEFKDSNKIGIDLSSSDLFISSNFYNDNQQCNLSQCLSFDRISRILNKYGLWIRKKNDDNNDNDDNDKKDTEHIDNIYFNDNYNDTNLLNDYNHLLFHHSSQFEDIHNILIEKSNGNKTCDLSKCQILKRNQRDRSRFSANYNLLKELYLSSDHNDDDNEHVIIRQQLIDRIHCHYFHSFDIGYKIKRNTLNNLDDDEQEMKANDDNNNCFDQNVYKINEWIASKRSKYKNIDGLERLINENNKFIFQPQEIQKEEEEKKEEKEEKGKEQTGGVYEYCYGKRYFYWDYYKHNDDIHDDAHWATNTNFGTGPANSATSKVSDWYIPKKYNDFKDELLNNEIYVIAQKQWNNLKIKATKFIDADNVRQIAICPRTFTAKCYDMKEDQLIQKEHLIAIMIYCNYDVLQFEFTKTFRYKNQNETDQEMIDRHRNYYHLGRLLRECAECFGIKRKEIKSDEHFSLWHGLNKHFRFSSIYAFIKGPVSTSTDYCVAAGFCTNAGTIINININLMQHMYEWGENREGMLRKSMFDCHWISDYTNEQEIFFIGGLNVFNFHTIIHAPKAENYCKYIKGLKQMTVNMYTGAGFESVYIAAPSTCEEKQIVFRLLSHELYRYYPNDPNAYQFKSCPEYVKQIVHEHCKHIQQISFSKNKQYQCDIIELLFKYDDGWIKIDLLNTMFPNLQVVNFQAQDKDISFLKRSRIYHSLLSFLKKRTNTKLEAIQIEMDPNHESEILDYIQCYEEHFAKYSWDIYVFVFENMYEGTGIDEVKKSVNLRIHDKKYKPWA